jgi:hypothetical protein
MNLTHTHIGHTHPWDAAMTRRKFLGSAALAGGAALTAGMWPSLVMAESEEHATVFPRPIPGGVLAFGTIPIHHFPPIPVLGPGPINEPSAMTDFKGIVGVTRVLGSGVGTDTITGVQTRLNYQVDNGFNTGLYIGEDGKRHRGTFAFI